MPKLIEKMFVEIEDEIKKGKEYDNITLFRGSELQQPLKIGDKISDKAFMSKTIDPVVALTFTKNSYFVLHYPGKSRHLYIAPFSRFPVEKELLTFAGEIFEIKAVFVYAEKNYYLGEFTGYEELDIEIIPYPKPPSINGVRGYLLHDYVVVNQKTNEVGEESKFQFCFTGERKMLEESEENYHYLPIGFFSDEEPEDLERKIIGSFYAGDLLGVYLVKIPGYYLFDIKSKNGELETETKEDIFTLTYCLITGNYVSYKGDDPKPDIKILYEK
jgi:hypothetical protein